MLTVSGNLHAGIKCPQGLKSGRRLPGRLEVKVNFPVRSRQPAARQVRGCDLRHDAVAGKRSVMVETPPTVERADSSGLYPVSRLPGSPITSEFVVPGHI